MSVRLVATLCAFSLAGTGCVSPGNPAAAGRPDAPRLEMGSHFWINLHHFLNLLAAEQRNAVPDRPTVRAALQDMREASLSEAERRDWQQAIDFYGREIVSLEHWSAPLSTVQTLLATARDFAISPALPVDGLSEILSRAAPVYRRHWWATHDAANRRWIAEQEELREEHGEHVAEFLARAFVTAWPSDPIPVEVAAHVTFYGAFQQDDPVRLHLSSTYEAHQGSRGLEQLYHEAGHLLGDRLFDALMQELRRQQKDVRRGTVIDLAHKVLFYTAGAAVSRSIPGHVPYAEASGVWARGPVSRDLLERHWRPYLEARAGFDEAVRRMISALE